MTKKFLTLIMLLLFLVIPDGQTAWLAKAPASSPEISYFGRWEKEGDTARCGYGAAYLRAKFKGTGIKAELSGEQIWWRVSIDGGEFKRFQPAGRESVLAENLAPGEHSVLLVRSTEGQAGVSEFRGFEVIDGELLEPEQPKVHRLEFVGDSITAGAFNDGVWIPGKNSYYDVEDNDMAYGPQLARMLAADYSVVAKSGQGVVHNYAEKWPYQGLHGKDTYGLSFFPGTTVQENYQWDTKKFPVDAVIISLGTNDLSSATQMPLAGEFKAGYHELLSEVRRLNPQAVIICVEPLPDWCGAEVRSWIRQTVARRRTLGDKNIYFIAVNEYKPLLAAADYADGNTHPTKEGSAKFAEYLKDKVSTILGW